MDVWADTKMGPRRPGDLPEMVSEANGRFGQSWRQGALGTRGLAILGS